MGVFRTNCHASVLVRYLFLTASDSCCRNTACYLYRALVEQRTLCLTGASSALGLIRRQAIEATSLGNWIPLRSRLAPIPFKGGCLFADEVLQQADSLDKEQEQLKKARSFGGPFRGFFRIRPGGGSKPSAPTSTVTSQMQYQPSRGGRGGRSRSRSRSRSQSRGRGRSRSSSRSGVSFKEAPQKRH